MAIRVLLADDHQMFRDGLRLLLERAAIEVTASVANGREAVAGVATHQPDVAIMDLTMPEMNGLEAAAVIRRRYPGVSIVILSMHSSAEYVHRARKAGALGYVLKDAVSEEIVAAVREAVVGRSYLSERLRKVGKFNPGSGPLDSLSSRERQVMQLVVEGKSSAEIAAIVHLSPKSVQTYRTRLMRKLGVDDVAGLVKFALRHGLTPE